MPLRCTICSHPERTAIDAALVADADPLRTLAERYGVSHTALFRHKETHLLESLTQAQAAAQVAQADDLLSQVQDLQRRTLKILKTAEETKALGLALGAIREARNNLELLAKLEGKLREQQTVNILIAPQWLELRTVILGALVDYPEARLALAQRLSEVQHAG